MNQEGNGMDIRPQSVKELIALYGVCARTVRNWIKSFKEELGDRHGNYYTVAQVELIYRKLGPPGKKLEGE